MQQISPFDLLTQISVTGACNALPLPDEETLVDDWRGIGFRSGGQVYVVSMDEVDEVLTLPIYTKVPGVKNWLNGVANIRGRLLSVVDLGAMLGKQSYVSTSKSRVLTIRKDDLYSGFIVDEVLGLQMFPNQGQSEKKLTSSQEEDFITGSFEKDGQYWAVFSLYQVAEAAEFLNVTS